MKKIVALIWRKPTLSKEEFKDYYETQHVPLILGLFTDPLTYRRNYVTSEPDSVFSFDVITEIVVRDETSLLKLFSVINDPIKGPKIAADEEKFMDRSRSLFLTVDFFGDL